MKVEESLRKPKTRADKERHLTAIRDAFWVLTSKNQRPPTQREIAAETGLSEQTVSKRVNEANLHKTIETNPDLKMYATLTPDVMWGIFTSAMSGNASSAKLWMKLMGWRETKPDCARCRAANRKTEGLGDALVRISRERNGLTKSI